MLSFKGFLEPTETKKNIVVFLFDKNDYLFSIPLKFLLFSFWGLCFLVKFYFCRKGMFKKMGVEK